MIKISIKKQNIVTNEAMFESEELALEWLNKHKAMGSFGLEAYSFQSPIELEPAIPAQTEEQELLDEEGQSFDPPQFETVEISPEVPAVMGTETIEVPAEFEIEMSDVTAEVDAESLRQEKIAKGKAAREACQAVLDLIAGYNLDRELTMEQISQLQNLMSQPEAALRAGRPSLAKMVISAIQPDGDLVTEEMKSEALLLLLGY